jgi:hypothetical protein
MGATEEVKSIKTELANMFFDGHCYICHKDHHKKGMTFHHKKYIVNDVIHSNYPKNPKGNLQYYKDLSVLIKKQPNRFLYLCSPHHQALEKLLRYGKETRKRLYRAVAMSEGHR